MLVDRLTRNFIDKDALGQHFTYSPLTRKRHNFLLGKDVQIRGQTNSYNSSLNYQLK